MRKSPLFIIIIQAFILNYFIHSAGASEETTCENGYCIEQAEPGNQGFNSRVEVTRSASLPSSVEYKRPPDEVFSLNGNLTNHKEINVKKVGPFNSGDHKLSSEERADLKALAQNLSGKSIKQIEVIGYADIEHLTPEAKSKYKNNLNLSQARAKEVAGFLKTQPNLKNVAITNSGKGENQALVQCDAKNANSSSDNLKAYQDCLSPNRRVEINVWYKLDAPKGCKGKQAKDSGLPFRISVDGEPLLKNDSPNSADITRCTDLTLEKADIQVRFDGNVTRSILNVTAYPDGAVRGQPVTFTPYSNYIAFIEKAEVRIFAEEESIQKTPLAIIPLNKTLDQNVKWKALEHSDSRSVQYVLRVYDDKGNFDETKPKILELLDKHRPLDDEQNIKREQLIGYGEDHLSIRNIKTTGGAIVVNGTELSAGTKVWIMNHEVPVDKEGKFAYQQIVPAGSHTVSIATHESNGRHAEFNRVIYIPYNDWFYVGLADLTAGHNNIKGPANLFEGENSKHYKKGAYTDGRLAYYFKGKVKNDWLLTSSADTREQPIKDLFSNFSQKDPYYLLRRIDSNAYYPVYGDDSTSIEDAPTQGKFYVKLQKDDAHVMWGNFQTKINGTDLLNYSRSLYGANAEYKSLDTTQFGERQTEAQLFTADPGSVSSLEEFRGTGGSLYYLRAQDVVVGSERVRIETRDRDSGIVLETKNLVYGQDYEINYLQGRIILREALSSTTASKTIVNVGGLSGNPVYLIAGYEYVPGVTAIDNMTKGGRASHWINDFLKIGVTGYQQDNIGAKQNLKGADATLRYAPGTYIKLEAGKSKGPGSGSLSSLDGGFDFNSIPQTHRPDIEANAYRAETGIDLTELGGENWSGKISSYVLKKEDGYSSPGQLTNEGITQSGLKASLPFNDKFSLDAKGDLKKGKITGDVKSGEVAGNYKVTDENTVSLAVRSDNRETLIGAGYSNILAETGTRTDGAVKVTHAPLNEQGEKERYEIYGLGQATIDKDDTRSRNNRAGAGGRYDINDRISLLGEATNGDGGWGGKAEAEYRASDRTSYYTNYLLDTERSDTGFRGRNNNITTGVKSRYTDSLSVFGEQRYQSFDEGPSGLIHSFGLDLAANDRWTWGSRFEKGKLSDPGAGDLKRTALSGSVGYNFEKTKYAGTLEWRDEKGNILGKRTSWLMKNKFGYQTTPDWRFLAGLNFAISDSGFGSNYDAEYTELSLGYAYRPVLNDKLNALFKYVYLDDHASPGQVSPNRNIFANTYQQRSHVIAVDTIYDLTPKLSLGGKVGYRIGEIKDRSLPNAKWFHSHAYLGIIRTDYHIVKEWDLLAELRYLNVKAAKDKKYGPLIGVYRHINQNLKVGIGYNFTTFSDDLTNLDYKARGVFINFIGKF